MASAAHARPRKSKAPEHRKLSVAFEASPAVGRFGARRGNVALRRYYAGGVSPAVAKGRVSRVGRCSHRAGIGMRGAAEHRAALGANVLLARISNKNREIMRVKGKVNAHLSCYFCVAWGTEAMS